MYDLYVKFNMYLKIQIIIEEKVFSLRGTRTENLLQTILTILCKSNICFLRLSQILIVQNRNTIIHIPRGGYPPDTWKDL